LTINELLEIFSRTFQNSFDLKKYDIFLWNQQLDSMTNLDFTHLDDYQRFQIRLHNNPTTKILDPIISDRHEIVK
jgi:hypothetical protein